jgi:drug/metabolite transporter (DMT)-like permease
MTTHTVARMGTAEWAMLILLSIIWGGSFFFNAVALQELPPLLVVWCRVLIGGLGLVVLLSCSSIKVRPYLSHWKEFLAMGILNTAIPFSLIVWGQQHIHSGLAAVINATTPAFTIMVTAIFTTDERASVRKFAGAAIGLGGVATLIGTDALSGLGNHVLGQLAVMSAACFYAISATYGRRLYGIPPMVTACFQLLSSAAVLTLPTFLITKPWALALPGPEVIGSLIGLGLICSGLAYILFFRILATAGATNVQLVTLLIPFSASTLGITILGEPFSWRLAAGMIIVTTAVLLIDGRFRFPLKKQHYPQ